MTGSLAKFVQGTGHSWIGNGTHSTGWHPKEFFVDLCIRYTSRFLVSFSRNYLHYT